MSTTSTDACSRPAAPLNPRSSAPEPLAQLVEQQPFKVGIVGNGLQRTPTESIRNPSRCGSDLPMEPFCCWLLAARCNRLLHSSYTARLRATRPAPVQRLSVSPWRREASAWCPVLPVVVFAVRPDETRRRRWHHRWMFVNPSQRNRDYGLQCPADAVGDSAAAALIGWTSPRIRGVLRRGPLASYRRAR